MGLALFLAVEESEATSALSEWLIPGLTFLGIIFGSFISLGGVAWQQRSESSRQERQRRLEFDRQTLKDLEEAIIALERALWDYGDWAYSHWLESRTWPRPRDRFDTDQPIDIPNWPELADAHRLVRLVTPRVFDEELRAEIDGEYEERYKLIVEGPADDSQESVEAFMKAAGKVGERYLVRIGPAYRRAYGIEEKTESDA